MLKKIAVASLLAASVMTAIAVVAQNPKSSPVASKMEAFVVGKNRQGKEIVTRSSTVAPGQIMEYHLTYGNLSDKAVKGMVVTGPIPSEAKYIANSASGISGSKLMVSVDHGKTFESEPVRRVVKDARGRDKTVVLGPEKYTHLRWNGAAALPAGTQQVYTYRVQVK